jgi:hypothetical protein
MTFIRVSDIVLWWAAIFAVSIAMWAVLIGCAYVLVAWLL